jgi:2-oxoisovalerate dehydrogenase E2 component (dihydrolipoyl transacylase)
MASVQRFLMPDIGEGLTEGTVIEWLVTLGQEIALNAPLVVVETAKATVELPSPYAGTVQALLAQENESVPVGAPLVEIADRSAEGTAPAAVGHQTSAAATGSDNGQGQAEMLVGSGPHGDLAVRRRRQRAPSPQGAPADSTTTTPAAPASPVRGATSNPLVRRLAGELGVDLNGITGSGPAGSVTRGDVLVAADRRSAEPERAIAPPTDAAQRIHADPIRRRTAQRMVESYREIPHSGTWTTVNVTPALDFIASVNAGGDPAQRLNLNALIAAAIVRALVEQPILNSSWDAEHDDILIHPNVNLGVATASMRGLVVPNIKHAQRLSLAELSAAIRQLTENARQGRATPADLTGGTATFTNIGAKANVGPGRPIIKPPECVIVAAGRVNRRPWVVEDQLAIADLLELSISIDHRIIDGLEAATFLETIANYVGSPARLLYAMQSA